jgi:hypothetical protein
VPQERYNSLKKLLSFPGFICKNRHNLNIAVVETFLVSSQRTVYYRSAMRHIGSVVSFIFLAFYPFLPSHTIGA